MAKETKEDRLARSVFEQVSEHLHELKALENGPLGSKESEVEKWCQSFLKNCFGYTHMAGYSIRSQESKGKLRADLVVYKNDKPIFLVEVKRHGFDLNKSDFRSGKTQLGEYLDAIGGVKWGILCNGTQWKLFDFSNPKLGGVEIAAFDAHGDEDEISLDKKVVEEFCYEMLDFHEHSFSTDAWPALAKEATAFSPESLAKAILSADVIKYIAKSIRGEYEYKANLEVLTEKVHWLVVEGLNDAIPGWNDARAAEYKKYVKSQKRVSRKTKRASKSSVAVSELSPTETASTNELVEIKAS